MEQRSSAECVGHTMGREWTSGAIFVPASLPGVLPPPPHSETGGAPEHAHAPTPGQMPSEARKTYSSCPGSSRGGRNGEAVTGGPTCSIFSSPPPPPGGAPRRRLKDPEFKAAFKAVKKACTAIWHKNMPNVKQNADEHNEVPQRT